MKKKILGILICMSFIAATVLPAAGTLNDYKIEKNNSSGGWLYLSSYPNYSPSGIPDFSQLQNKWQVICDGGNGIAESTAVADDVQVAPLGSPVYPDPIAPIVAPGPNCFLESSRGGDDLIYWMFCAPTSYANCLWWCDSIFSDPDGIPGDGEDNFLLVENYGASDDHSPSNVPLLVCRLANLMNISTKGYGYYEDIIYGLNKWFINTGFDDRFDRVFYEKPTFDYVVDEFRENNFIILVIGFYNKVGDEYVFKGEHCTSIAGINSDNYQIAISDPGYDIENPGGPSHNDAQYVSYDIYDVEIGSPAPEIDCEWWLPDYAEGLYQYTVVTVVDVITPPKADINCIGSISWIDIKPGDTVSGSFIIENIGTNSSLLDWNITSTPNWGTWMFDPESGLDLTPDDGSLTINLTCVAPDKKNNDFKGRIKIENQENPDDYCYVDVSLSTSKNKPFNFNFFLLRWLFNFLPNAFLILLQLLGL